MRYVDWLDLVLGADGEAMFEGLDPSDCFTCRDDGSHVLFDVATGIAFTMVRTGRSLADARETLNQYEPGEL